MEKYHEKLEKQNQQLREKLKSAEMYIESLDESNKIKNKKISQNNLFFGCLLAEEIIDKPYKCSERFFKEYIDQTYSKYASFCMTGRLPVKYISENICRQFAYHIVQMLENEKEEDCVSYKYTQT